MSTFESDPKRRALLNLLLREEGLEPLSALKIGRRKAGDSIPLSFTQQQMWFLDQLVPGNTSYKMATALRLKGALDIAALEKSFNEIVRRYESLRTTFVAVEGIPEQRIASPVTVTLPVIDLMPIPESERAAQLTQLVTEKARRSFDLSQGPLLRLMLLRVTPAEHVLLIESHHIIMDALSWEVLFRELAALYEAFSTGRPSPLAGLPLQYADFVHWQRERLQGDVLEQHLSYWKKQLDGAPQLLELPTDRPRPSVQTFQRATQSMTLPKSLIEELKGLSRREKATLFMTLLAAFQALLSRITGQEDIVVGSPIAGRNRPELEGLIGLFINTLVLRTDLSGNPSFRDLLRRVREVVLGAFAHQEVPFEELMQELQPTRSLNRNTLFQVLLTYRQLTVEKKFKLPGLTVDKFPFRRGGAKFDLTLAIVERPESLRCSFVYNTDLFDAETILRMVKHFQTLLESIVANPNQRLSALPLLSHAERQQLLVEWNDTKEHYPVETCIHELFERQVARTPDAAAVVFEEQQLTYRQLNEQANRVGFLLAEKGIGRGSFVPFLMDRSIEVPIAMLAIIKAGAAFVPLDIHWPIAKIKQILEELSSEVILVNQTTPYGEEVIGCAFLPVNEQTAIASTCTNLNLDVDSGEPIYTIYTSGSTGKPKGAVVPHRGITNRFLWMNEFFGPSAAGAALQTTHHVYDSAVWQLFWPLINGGKTVIPAPGMETEAGYLAELIYSNKVTITDFVPSVFNTIVPQVIHDLSIQEKLQSLRTIIVGGEEITPSTTYAFMAQFPAVRVMNLYGPTEASIGCICYEVTGKEGGRIPIGRPISNVHTLVLDKNRNLVPIGVAGDLYLSGICLGLGYLNDKEKTKAAFVDNPFPEIPYDKLYKTGDLVRYLPDGNIDFLGRLDHQVKVRGFRIELGEIETVLSQHSAVREVVVVAREESSGDKRLIAYFVPRQEGASTINELRSFVREKLPEYMVPSAFVLLNSLPLTPSGKVDRRALPPVDTSRPDLTGTFVAPRNSVEEVLAGIWAKVLKLERIGVHDNFFELGGHSLRATQVMSLARTAFQLEIALRKLFENPTVAGLAVQIVQLKAKESSPEEMIGLLADLESISDEEAQTLLAREIRDEPV